MKKVILDASFFLSYLLPDEKSEQKIFTQFKNGKLKLIEPAIFSLEITNALRYAFNSNRISKKQLLKTINLFENLSNIDYVYDFNLSELTRLAIKKDLSIYDTCYLALQLKTNYPLYSLDEKLSSSINN